MKNKKLIYKHLQLNYGGVDSYWWNGYGSIPTNRVRAAWNSKGAINQPDSYIDRTGNGYDLTPEVTPSWNQNTGWTCTGTEYLSSTFSPTLDQTWSMVVRVANVTPSAGEIRTAIGCLRQSGGTAGFFLIPAYTDTFRFYGNGAWTSNNVQSGAQTDCVMSFCGTTCYLNDSTDGSVPAGVGTYTLPLYIGAINNADSPAWFMVGDILAAAVFNITLTSTQQSALYNSILAI
jgi:hypothetical protein